MTAFTRYYLELFIYNLSFSIVFALLKGAMSGLVPGVTWGVVCFALFGVFISERVFTYFKKKEYYFYHNMGYTRKTLLLKTWGVNMLIALPVILILFFT